MDLKSLVAQAGADKPIQPSDMISDESSSSSKLAKQTKPVVHRPQTAKQVGYGVIVYTQQPDGCGGQIIKPRFHTRPDDQLDYETASKIRDTYIKSGMRAVAFAIVEVDY